MWVRLFCDYGLKELPASIGATHYLYDLVYNPGETLFLTKGKEKGAAIKNGLDMLHIQAEESWAIWNASKPIQQ